MKQELLSLGFLEKLVLCLVGNMRTMFHATAVIAPDASIPSVTRRTSQRLNR